MQGRDGEPEQRALLQGAEDARDEGISETEDAFLDSLSEPPAASEHGQHSALGAAANPPILPAKHHGDTRKAADAATSGGASMPASAVGQDKDAELAPLAADPVPGAEQAYDSGCLPLESLCGDADSLHSAGSLQHIVTQPGSLAAAAAVGMPAGAQAQPPVSLDSTGAIVHMSPIIPTPFSQATPLLEEGAGLTDTMQRLPTAAVLPSAHSAGLYTVPAHQTDARSNHHVAAPDSFSAMHEPTMWPGISDAPTDGHPAVSEATVAIGAPSPVQLPDPSIQWPLPPAALLPDPDVRRDGSGVRSTPSPKKHRLMWAPDAPGWASRADATAAAAERHAYADTDGDWLSEPESSADSASSRLAKRPRQVRVRPGLMRNIRRASASRAAASSVPSSLVMLCYGPST